MKVFLNKSFLSLFVSSIIYFIVFTNNVNAESVDVQKNHGFQRYGVVTSNHVLSINYRFNNLLKEYIKLKHPDAFLKIKSLKIKPVIEKQSEDVFVQLNALVDIIDTLNKEAKLATIKKIKKINASAIPAEVFLQTAILLDNFIFYMDTLMPEKQWGAYYGVETFEVEKTVNDVFSLVGLSLEQIKIALNLNVISKVISEKSKQSVSLNKEVVTTAHDIIEEKSLEQVKKQEAPKVLP